MFDVADITADLIAQAELAELLHDMDSAEQWYRKAVELGDVSGMVHLGRLRDEAGDAAGAIHWWLWAAERRATIAMFCLGSILLEIGLSDEAMHWLQRGAEAGDLVCERKLGDLNSPICQKPAEIS